MAKPTSPKADPFEVEVEEWRRAIERGDLDSAITHAANALQIASGRKERALLKTAMSYLEATVEKAEVSSSLEKSTMRCSFCGRTRDEVRLLVGSGAQICEHCARSAFKFFVEDVASDSR
jgi:hypothetical protein